MVGVSVGYFGMICGQVIKCPKRWLSHIPFPYDGAILVTSCASFEMGQKCVSAGGISCSPSLSSLNWRAERAERAEQTELILVGFCRPERTEIYSGCQRILLK
ncbi:MAG: formate dehydrogenase accessory sulfurtransferase FdhD [Aeromonas sobria]|uniref:formate dehydrogenase accessory sulfurtransferase FdhD n=1 Tax=Aeromonas sobria TaxID=646 RepID=UPI003F3648C7